MLLQCRSSACSLPLRSQMLQMQTSPPHKSKRRKTRHSLLYLINFCGSTIKITSPRAVLSEEVNQLAHNKVIVAAGVSAAIGQLSKPFTAVFINGKEFDYKAAFQAGGFPSTHSSAVVAAAVSLGLERGLSDSIFGLTVVYACLVMYDSQGVRREVGNHAKVVNKLLQEKMRVTSSIGFEDQDYKLDSQLENVPSPSMANIENLSPLLLEKSKNYTKVEKRDEEIQTSLTLGLAAEGEKGLKRFTYGWTPLKETVGHSEVEVIAGALLGVLVSMMLNVFV